MKLKFKSQCFQTDVSNYRSESCGRRAKPELGLSAAGHKLVFTFL
ncbi:hypothetical protein [uncultured Bacteroides sp.]|nr:hypothetical protein [uncultured Bacteroides sp.]